MCLPSNPLTNPRKDLKKTVIRQLYMKQFSENESCNLKTLNTLTFQETVSSSLYFKINGTAHMSMAIFLVAGKAA